MQIVGWTISNPPFRTIATPNIRREVTTFNPFRIVPSWIKLTLGETIRKGPVGPLSAPAAAVAGILIKITTCKLSSVLALMFV